MKKLVLIIIFIMSIASLYGISYAQTSTYGYTIICGMGKVFKPTLTSTSDSRYPSWWSSHDRTPCVARQNLNIPSVRLEGYCSPFPGKSSPVGELAPFCQAGTNEKVNAYACNTGSHLGEGCGATATASYQVTNRLAGSKYSMADFKSSLGSNFKCGQTVQFDVFNKNCSDSMISQHYRNVAGLSNPSGDDDNDGTENVFESQYFVPDSSGVPTFCLAKDAFVWHTGICPSNNLPDIVIEGPTTMLVGETKTWQLTATDAEGKIDTFGAYIGTGTVPASITDWATLYYTNPATPFGNTTVTTNSWTCPSAGTYTIAANATDDVGGKCSGNPITAGVVRCASGKDLLTVTCRNPNSTPQCSIYGLSGDLFVGESRSYTVSSSDPDGGNNVFTALYSSPISSPGWTLLGQTTTNNAAGTFTCTIPGSYYLACNTRDNENSFCSGSPFPHTFADCGSFDSRTIVCRPNTTGITLKNELATTSQSKGTSPYKGSDILTFKVTVTNTGTSSLSNVIVSENIPSYTSFAPTQSAILNSGKAGTWVLSNGKYNFNIGTLAGGASYNVYYAVVVNNYTTPGTYASSNTACSSATGIASGPCGTVNFDLEDIVASKKLKVTQELVTSSPIFRGSPPYVYEDVLVFRITATNEGNQRLDDVMLQDTVPAYSQFLSGETNELNGTLKGAWDCSKESAGGLCTIPIGSLNPGASYFVYYVVSITNYIDNEADIKSKNDACATALGLSAICSSYPFDLKDLTVNPGTKISGLLLNYTGGSCDESATNPKLKESDVKDGVANFKLRNGTTPPVLESYDFSTNKFYFEEILDPTKNTVICADKLTPATVLGAGSFRLSCVKLNGSSANLVQNGKCTADLSSHLNFENTNAITLGFEYVPVSADPWIQTESGDVYSGSLSSGESIINIIQKVGSYMVTKIGSVFGNKDVLVEDVDGASRYSQKGAKVQKFIKTNESAWPTGFEFSSPSATPLSTSSCSLENKVYKASNSAFATWLSNCAVYSISDNGLSVIYVSGNTTFDNEDGLRTDGNGRLIVVINGNATITDSFGKDSNKAKFGLITKSGVEFADSGVGGLDTLEFEGFIATSGSNKDIKFVRSLEVANEDKPAVNVVFDPKYTILLSEQKLQNADEALGLTKFDLIWEIYD